MELTRTILERPAMQGKFRLAISGALCAKLIDFFSLADVSLVVDNKKYIAKY